MPIQFDYSNIDIDLNEIDDLDEFVSDGDVDTDRIFAQEEGEASDVTEKFAKVIVIENVPVGVPQEKHEKLSDVLTRTLKQFGDLETFGFQLGLRNDNSTDGWCFVTFKRPESVEKALKYISKGALSLGKNNVLSAFPYTKLRSYLSWPEEYTQPPKPDSKTINLNSWLENVKVRDMYLLRHADMTEIHWCEGAVGNATGSVAYDGADQRKEGKIWCELYTQWSPKGSYLLTFHGQGVALWGGERFQKIQRFHHRDVMRAEFSDNEEFLFTWKGDDRSGTLNGWEVKTGRLMRSMKIEPIDKSDHFEWPVMRWSAGGKYFARRISGGIQLYDASTFRLVDNKPVKLKGIVDFAWSPTDPVLAYWAPEVENLPARVVITDPVSKTEVRAKNLFNVRKVDLHWQDSGDFLCAQVLRHSKTGKTTFTNFEIFRMRDANVPNEMIEIKDTIEEFAWEPSRERFAIVHKKERVGGHIFKVSVYSLDAIKGGNSITVVHTIENNESFSLHWSPAGSSLLLKGVSANSTLEFWNVDESILTSEDEHFSCNEVHWDPSGRLVTTAAVAPLFGTMKYGSESGFRIWSADGKLLRKNKVDDFYQFLWRPRPKTILDDKAIQKIHRGIKGYMARFAKEDDTRKKFLEAAASKAKVDTLRKFRSLVEKRKEKASRLDEERLRLGLAKGINENDYEVSDEVEEVFVSQSVEPLEE